MKLSQLLERMDYECIQGSVDIPVSHLLYDSRNACPDGVFVCISGAVMDGHKFIPDVITKGVTAVIVEKDVMRHGSLPGHLHRPSVHPQSRLSWSPLRLQRW